jgi:hypothetical protein
LTQILFDGVGKSPRQYTGGEDFNAETQRFLPRTRLRLTSARQVDTDGHGWKTNESANCANFREFNFIGNDSRTSAKFADQYPWLGIRLSVVELRFLGLEQIDKCRSRSPSP